MWNLYTSQFFAHELSNWWPLNLQKNVIKIDKTDKNRDQKVGTCRIYIIVTMPFNIDDHY